MASRFWVGGTGTWDASDTTHWSATTGGAGGASVPGAADTVTFDASSGGGTITLGYSPTVSSITMGAYVGTFTVGEYSPTMGTFSSNGTGIRTINMGSGTWTITSNATMWDMSTTTNLTFNCQTSTVKFTAALTTERTCALGSLTYFNVWVATTGAFGTYLTGANTINTLRINPGRTIRFSSNLTNTITNPVFTGASGNIITIRATSAGQRTTLAKAGGGTVTCDYCTILDCAGSPANTWYATNSTNGGNNSGITFSAPSTPSGNGFFYLT